MHQFVQLQALYDVPRASEGFWSGHDFLPWDVQMDQVIEENSQLRSQVEANLQARSQLTSELEELRGKYRAMAALNSNMEAEVQALRQSLQVWMAHIYLLLSTEAVLW